MLGQADELAKIICPVERLDKKVSGTLKSTFIISRSSRVVINVPGDINEPGDTFRMPSTPSKGALKISSFNWALATLSFASDSLTIDSCSSNAERAVA